MSKYEKIPVNYETIEPTREFYEGKQHIIRIIDENDLKEPMDLSISKKIKGFISLQEDNPSFLNEFDYELNSPLTPDNLARQTHKKIWWTISVTERNTMFIISWKAAVNKRQFGRNCPYLSNQRVHPLYNSLQVMCKDIASEWCYEKNSNLEPTKISPHTPKKVFWKCKECNYVYPASISNRTKKLNPTGCPECNKSKFQKFIENILRENDIDITTEVPLYKRYSFDIGFDNNNSVVECDGGAHWKSSSFFEKKNTLAERIIWDNDKNNYALENGILLLRIPYQNLERKISEKRIREWINLFVNSKQIPEEIIEFYEEKNPQSNYPEIARIMNTWVTQNKKVS